MIFYGLPLLSLLGLFGVMPAFHYLQSKARSEMKARIKAGVPEYELRAITFSSGSSIPWVRKGKEFKIDGKMYDVVRCEGNTYYCVDDEQETRLFAHLDELCRQQNDKEGNPVQDFVKSLTKYLPTANCSLPPNSELRTQNSELFKSELAGFTRIPYSPPEMI